MKSREAAQEADLSAASMLMRAEPISCDPACTEGEARSRNQESGCQADGVNDGDHAELETPGPTFHISSVLIKL